MTRSPAFGALALVFSLLAASACAPPCGTGTHAEGGVCVATLLDAGGDASTPPSDSSSPTDAAPSDGTVIAAGDELLFDPQYNHAETIPGFVRCLTPAVRHSDGTITTLDATTPGLTVTTESATLVQSTQPGDCGGQAVGVIGLAAGSTFATVSLAGSGPTLSARFAVTVLPYHLAFDSFGGAGAPVGGTETLRFNQIRYSSPDAPEAPLGCGCDIVPRWVSLEIADPTIASLTAMPGGSWTVRGLMAGDTTLVVHYQIPGAAVINSAPRPYSVFAPGTLVSAAPQAELVNAAGEPFFSGTFSPGTCLFPRLIGTYQTTYQGRPVTYTQPLTDGVTWTSGTASGRIDAGPPVQFCAVSFGDAFVRGCYAGNCGVTNSFLVLDQRLTALTATLTNMQDAVVSTAASGNIAVCPHVRISGTKADGTSVDLTSSTSFEWNTVFASGAMIPVPWFRSRRADGTADNDAAGNPCLLASSPTGAWNMSFMATTTVFGGGVSAHFSYTIAPFAR